MSVLVFCVVGDNGLGSGGNTGNLKDFVKPFHLSGVEVSIGRGVSSIDKPGQGLGFQCCFDVLFLRKPMSFITKVLEFRLAWLDVLTPIVHSL